ncbi:9440_t:CDS:2, partial [Entrophospora sp. SA101]
NPDSNKVESCFSEFFCNTFADKEETDLTKLVNKHAEKSLASITTGPNSESHVIGPHVIEPNIRKAKQIAKHVPDSKFVNELYDFKSISISNFEIFNISQEKKSVIIDSFLENFKKWRKGFSENVKNIIPKYTNVKTYYEEKLSKELSQKIKAIEKQEFTRVCLLLEEKFPDGPIFKIIEAEETTFYKYLKLTYEIESIQPDHLNITLYETRLEESENSNIQKNELYVPKLHLDSNKHTSFKIDPERYELSTPDGSCIVVFVKEKSIKSLQAVSNEDDIFKAHVYFCSNLGSTANKRIITNSDNNRYSNLKGKNTNFKHKVQKGEYIVIKKEKLSVVDVISNTELKVAGVYQSLSLDNDTWMDFQIEPKTKLNGFIDAYKSMFEKYPVESCIDPEQNQSLNLKIVLDVNDDVKHEIYGRNFENYVINMFNELKKPASVLKHFKTTVATFSGLDIEENNFISEHSIEYQLGEWIIQLSCLIPIQIAVAKNNQFQPLRDGLASNELDIDFDDEYGCCFGGIAENISLGWYEGIFKHFGNRQVKVVSSMDENYDRKFEKYVVSMFNELKKKTKKPASILKHFKTTVTTFSELDIEENDFISKHSNKYQLGDFVIQLSCLIPIQIAVAKNNQFQPLRDGLSSNEHDVDFDVEYGCRFDGIAESISLGWYEGIFKHFGNRQVKVVSSMGEQSCGKSYMLNHLVGTTFD